MQILQISLSLQVEQRIDYTIGLNHLTCLLHAMDIQLMRFVHPVFYFTEDIMKYQSENRPVNRKPYEKKGRGSIGIGETIVDTMALNLPWDSVPRKSSGG